MFRRAHLFTLVIITISTGCSAPAKIEKPVVIEKSHQVSITGIVTSVRSANVDMSGKNPRFILHFILKIESYDNGGRDTVPGPEIKCVITERDLLKQTGQMLKEGDRVLIISNIIEKKPDTIAVYIIKYTDREQNHDNTD
jgi:hypothetical protein